MCAGNIYPQKYAQVKGFGDPKHANSKILNIKQIYGIKDTIIIVNVLMKSLLRLSSCFKAFLVTFLLALIEGIKKSNGKTKIIKQKNHCSFKKPAFG